MRDQVWRNVLVTADIEIAEAVRAIDRGQVGIALVVDPAGHLIGTVTDGDIRRGLLQGISLTAPVSEIVHRDAKTAPLGSGRTVLLALMREHSVRQVPLLDLGGVVQGLAIFSELVPEGRLKTNPVVVMAGGEGRRLAPLTDATPKPLLPIGGRPLLDTILEQIADHGFRNVLLAVNRFGDQIQAHCGSGSRWGLAIEYIEEQERLGTAGALRLAERSLTEPFIVMNGDLLTQVNLDLMLAFHEDNKLDATVAVREHDVQIPFGTIRVSGERVARIEEKPIVRLFINAGLYVLDPKLVPFVPRHAHSDMPELLNRAIDEGLQVGMFPVREYWLDIGQRRDYDQASLDYERHFGHHREPSE